MEDVPTLLGTAYGPDVINVIGINLYLVYKAPGRIPGLYEHGGEWYQYCLLCRLPRARPERTAGTPRRTARGTASSETTLFASEATLMTIISGVSCRVVSTPTE